MPSGKGGGAECNAGTRYCVSPCPAPSSTTFFGPRFPAASAFPVSASIYAEPTGRPTLSALRSAA